MGFKEFYTCPRCGKAISGEKKEFFVCPSCGRALCQKKDLKQFDDKFCGNCGHELASAKKEALALAKEGKHMQSKGKERKRWYENGSTGMVLGNRKCNF